MIFYLSYVTLIMLYMTLISRYYFMLLFIELEDCLVKEDSQYLIELGCWDGLPYFELLSKYKRSRLIFKITRVLFIMVFGLTVFIGYNHVETLKNTIELFILVSFYAVLYGIDVPINHRYIKRCLNDEVFARKELEKEKKLPVRRGVFFIGYLVLVIVLFLIDLSLDDVVAILLIYSGLGGLIAKYVIIRLPVSRTGRLQVVVNTSVLIIGVLMLID